MPVIYSTLSADVSVNFFPKDTRGPAAAVRSVTIKGGAGVQNKRNFETPRGVATVIDAETLKQLQTHSWFKTQVKEGFLFIDDKEDSRPSEEDIDEVVEEEMTERDKGAQDTKEDYAKRGNKPPKTDKE